MGFGELDNDPKEGMNISGDTFQYLPSFSSVA
jgi:hypothetical protein